MRAITILALVGASVGIVTSRVNAQPVIALEGQWEGKCQRGSVVLNAVLIMDQHGGRLNGKTITGLNKGPFSVQFKEGKKTFSGTFSNNTTNLNGKLIADGKEAGCNLTRKVATSNRLCIRNIDQPQIFFRLEPGSPSTIRLLKGAETQIAGNTSSGNLLCWDVKDFTGCPRSLPQSTYAC
jgi:hypothetical protein